MGKLVKQNALILLTLAILLGLVLPVLVQDGMFMDAVQYTDVARNMAEGIGSFWSPHFTALNVGNLNAFHEQPPLGFGIQALFFYVLGNSIYVERLYTFLTFIAMLLLIKAIWQQMVKGEEERRLWFLPVLLWGVCPLTFWCYTNNMLENTMAVFIGLSVLFSIRALKAESRSLLFALLSGTSLFCASFTKGLPGLFPLAIPVLALFTVKAPAKKALRLLAVELLVLLALYAVVLAIPAGRESMYLYFVKRALFRMDNDPVVSSRFAILGKLLTEFLAPLIIGLLLWLWGRKRVVMSAQNIQTALFFALLGLCGVLPLMATRVQRTFYMEPAIPYLALGVAFFALPAAIKLFAQFQKSEAFLRTAGYLGLLGIMGVLVVSVALAGRVKRDKDLIADINTLSTVVAKGDTVMMSERLFWGNWQLRAYLMRYYYISGLPADTNRMYYLMEPGQDAEVSGYCPVPVKLMHYRLTKRCENP